MLDGALVHLELWAHDEHCLDSAKCLSHMQQQQQQQQQQQLKCSSACPPSNAAATHEAKCIAPAQVFVHGMLSTRRLHV